MKPSSRRGRPRQTAAPGAPGRTPWCGDRRVVVGTNRRRVSGHRPRSRGSHQLGCRTDRDQRRLAPRRERTGVLNRVKVALATLAADATLTRFPRAHRMAFIGASQDTDRSQRRTCVRSTGRRSQLDSREPHRSLYAHHRAKSHTSCAHPTSRHGHEPIHTADLSAAEPSGAMLLAGFIEELADRDSVQHDLPVAQRAAHAIHRRFVREPRRTGSLTCRKEFRRG